MNVEVAPEISEKLVPFNEDCHCMFPLLLLRVSLEELLPSQAVVGPEMVPAAVGAVTEIKTLEVDTALHAPLLTLAR